jgi:hypothetical protein
LSEAPATRRFPLVLIGVALIVIAAVLIAIVAVPKHRPAHADAQQEAATACRDFERVYGATRPGTPLNGQVLASTLDEAIDHMHKAASANAKWRKLASSLDDLGSAVNAGDAPSSYAAMQDIHDGCSGVVGTGSA